LISQINQLSGSLLRSVYLAFNLKIVEPWILPRFFSLSRLKKAQDERLRLNQIEADVSSTSLKVTSVNCLRRIWFHAASVGELEALWPLILDCAARGSELVITVLSESADRALENLIQVLSSQSASIIFSGYSPWESHWGEYLDRLQPSLFVTARYEAWPDLWVSLSERKIPLTVVAARDRKSLRVGQKLCAWMGKESPELLLFPCTQEDLEGLIKIFPKAFVKDVGDPRWDRVYERSRKGSSRASALVQAARDLPRPWGVFGSAWMEDLAFLFPKILDRQGTLWIVPHRIESESVVAMRDFLEKQGLRVITSTGLEAFTPGPRTAILVNEMGFLSELYSAADWAWVGGGFGKGIHSTLEPSIHGIPVGVGPRGTSQFAEVEALTGSGQLSVVSSSSDLGCWVMSSAPPEVHERWKKEALARLGATHRIIEALVSHLK
jgi:3-deoxy-D-manno-octulosonic-acid transferase